MELFAVDLDQLAGVVVEHGGPQSHAAILARSLGIPMVGQVPEFASLLRPGPAAAGGRHRAAWSTSTRRRTGRLTASELRRRAATPRRPPSATPMPPSPGLPRVEVNINLLYEARPGGGQGVGGVGLYRSEFLFLARRTLPTEEEQVGIYRKLLTQMEGRPVCIRTFDLRPDKLARTRHLTSAATRPFDWRLVLDSPPLQQTVPRAGAGHPARRDAAARCACWSRW